MEPWHFSHGEAPTLADAVAWLNASMEPWHFSHGEGPRPPRPDGFLRASMEPWHFSHGERACPDGIDHGSESFNGAMAF